MLGPIDQGNGISVDALEQLYASASTKAMTHIKVQSGVSIGTLTEVSGMLPQPIFAGRADDTVASDTW